MLSARRDLISGPTVNSTRFNFTRQSRLLAAADFDRVFRRARRSSDRYFTVLYRDFDLGYARLGLAIANRNIRLAVQRYRLKRMIRESFRLWSEQLPHCDVVVLARKPAADAARNQLASSLRAHWRRLASSADMQQRRH